MCPFQRNGIPCGAPDCQELHGSPRRVVLCVVASGTELFGAGQNFLFVGVGLQICPLIADFGKRVRVLGRLIVGDQRKAGLRRLPDGGGVFVRLSLRRAEKMPVFAVPERLEKVGQRRVGIAAEDGGLRAVERFKRRGRHGDFLLFGRFRLGGGIGALRRPRLGFWRRVLSAGCQQERGQGENGSETFHCSSPPAA